MFSPDDVVDLRDDGDVDWEQGNVLQKRNAARKVPYVYDNNLPGKNKSRCLNQRINPYV